MLVSKISSAMPSPAFKGIFIENGMEYIDNTYFDHGMEADRGTSHTTYYKDYYPFLNETKADINKAVKKESVVKKYSDEFVEHIHETKVAVKDRLPVTEAEGRAFMKKFHVDENDFVKFTELVKLVTRKVPKR